MFFLYMFLSGYTFLFLLFTVPVLDSTPPPSPQQIPGLQECTASVCSQPIPNISMGTNRQWGLNQHQLKG